jgi:predicted lipid carrier protein YhbT
MEKINIPAPVIAGVMKRIPSRAMVEAVAILMRHMRRRHQHLFRRLAEMDDAVVFIEPIDLPHNFILRLGRGGPSLAVSDGQACPVTASVKGKLESLLDLLEGRADGDTLFFSRTIVVTGDTSAIVGLRNILDGEDIQVMTEVLTLSGPLAEPAGALLRLAERAANRIRARVEAFHETLHQPSSADLDAAAEFHALRDEIQTLRARLAKIEVERKLAGRRRA